MLDPGTMIRCVIWYAGSGTKDMTWDPGPGYGVLSDGAIRNHGSDVLSVTMI